MEHTSGPDSVAKDDGGEGGEPSPPTDAPAAASSPEEEPSSQDPCTGWSYPLQGLGFLLEHPSLWFDLLLPIVASVLIGISVFVVVTAAGLYPQVLLLKAFTPLPPWASWLVSVALVLFESMTFSLVVSQLFLEWARTRIFRKVFQMHGLQFDSIDPVIYGTASHYCQWTTQRLIFLFLLFELVVTFPMNIIPFIGAITYAFVNGVSLAWSLQGVYFAKKGLSLVQQWEYIKANLKDYLAFGVVAMMLDVIPLLDIIFFYTNIIGSAIWAIEIEQAQKLENRMPPNSLIDDEGDMALMVDAEELI